MLLSKPTTVCVSCKLELVTKWQCEVAQLCPTLCDPMDCSLPGFSIHGVFQARTLEWGAISFSRGSSPPRDRTYVSCIAVRCFTLWATRELVRTMDYSWKTCNEFSWSSQWGRRKMIIKKLAPGHPWWFSGGESAWQCRRHRFDPWSRTVPHATEQPCPYTTTTEPVLKAWEPQLLSAYPAATEGCVPWSLHSTHTHTKPPRWEAQILQLENSPHSPQLEKKPVPATKTQHSHK